MKKKILIGCIIAVALLTLVSFSSVVGYSSVKSDNKVLSPLFGIRTNRAINNKQDAIESDYIGKGKKNVIPLPIRDEKMILLQKVVNKISKMDEQSRNELLERMSSYLDDEDLTIPKLVEFEQELNYSEINVIIGDNEVTRNGQECTIGAMWVPGCIIGVLLFFFMLFIFNTLLSTIFGCHGP